MVEGMSNCSLDFDFCEHCLYGKQNRVRFLCGASKAKGILYLIYADVFCPILVPSLGGSLYYVSFITIILEGVVIFHRLFKYLKP